MSALKVAILGASGIGKNHARWFHNHGCEVVSFLGSRPETLQNTQQVLADDFGFVGRGFTDLTALLKETRPDIVCISNPPALHFEQALQCLQFGAHVLCEKPLVYDPNLSLEQLQEQSETLVMTAQDAGLTFGTQLQYAAVTHDILRFCGHDGNVRRFAMEMETKNIKANREGAQIWIDLSPHPLSVLQVLADGDALDLSSIRCQVDAHQTRAQFRLQSGVEADITVRFNPHANPPIRRFTFDDCIVDVGGRKDAAGNFRAVLSNPNTLQEELRDDFVDSLIGNFVRAVRGEETLLVTGQMGWHNVAWQHWILAAAQK